METKKNYLVNPDAEKTLNTVAIIIHVLGYVFLAAGIGIGTWLGMSLDEDEFAYIYLILGIIGGLLISFIFDILWASLKVFVNISRSLYNINNDLEIIISNTSND